MTPEEARAWLATIEEEAAAARAEISDICEPYVTFHPQWPELKRRIDAGEFLDALRERRE